MGTQPAGQGPPLEMTNCPSPEHGACKVLPRYCCYSMGSLQQRNCNCSHFVDEKTEVYISGDLLRAPASKVGAEALLGYFGISHRHGLVVTSTVRVP